jgi:hypothetical protein
MADRLYLSLWYPNFRLESLPAALTGVMRQFALIGQKRVAAASAYPINFTEPPTYQRIYVVPEPTPEGAPPNNLGDTSDSIIETAVAEATEQLHDDMAYEFEMRWQLWTPEQSDPAHHRAHITPAFDTGESEIDSHDLDSDSDAEPTLHDPDAPWKLRTHTVRILGFGPSFDVAGYEQNGHLLVDFGLDTPWVLETLEDEQLDETAQIHIQQNVEKLLAFTLLVEKNCGISSRLLWTESGEPLAEKLIARLQRVN